MTNERGGAMLVTNLTNQDYWFGPLHLPAGNGSTLTVDDSSSTSLYLTSDEVADAIAYLNAQGKITVTSVTAGIEFPRATGTPEVLHGDGSPEGLVFASQGSIYMRRDAASASNYLYTKTTGMNYNTGWVVFNPGVGPTTYRKTTSKTVVSTTTATDLLNGEISVPAGTMNATTTVRLRAWGDLLIDVAAATQRFQLIFGGTTLIDTGAPASNATVSATRGGWQLEAQVLNLGVTNSQSTRLEAQTWVPGGFGGGWTTAFTTGQGASDRSNEGAHYFGVNPSTAVDTTATCALVLNVINAISSASYETKLIGAIVEVF
jgi:hypothetical protein